MAGLDRYRECLVTLLVAGLLGACGSAGSSKPEPIAPAADEISEQEEAPLPTVEEGIPDSPETVQETEPVAELPETLPEEIPFELDESEDPEESEDDTMVVIDIGAKDLTKKPLTLIEAARAERERRNLATPTDIVITDANLSEYATGELTETVGSSQSSSGAASELSEAEVQRAEEELFWRSGAREIRQAWRDAYDLVEVLEGEVFELRQRFYREDDGFYRDAEIKPAWDRSIDRLEEARKEVVAREEELVVFIEEGRSAGAWPGWLREGFDLEPTRAVELEETAEPAEPEIYRQEAMDPP